MNLSQPELYLLKIVYNRIEDLEHVLDKTLEKSIRKMTINTYRTNVHIFERLTKNVHLKKIEYLPETTKYVQ